MNHNLAVRSGRSIRYTETELKLIAVPLDGCSRSLCFTHHLDNLREKGIRTDPFRAHHETSRSIHRSSPDTGACPFLHRN